VDIEGSSEVMIPSDSDILRAATWFADIHGWKAPAKSDINLNRPLLNIEVVDQDTAQTLEKIKNVYRLIDE
jgi:hypothetical protein